MNHKLYRQIVFISTILIIPIGLASKFYRGPFDAWFNNSLGGVFYEMFWILLVILIWPKLSPGTVALGVFLVTAFLEFLQLWHPPFLTVIRATLPGRLLLGTTFVWSDFLYYIMGCTLSGWALHQLRHHLQQPEN